MNKRYCINNIQYTQEEYEQRKQDYKPEVPTSICHQSIKLSEVENSYGRDLANTKNAIFCDESFDIQDCKYCSNIFGSQDCMDFFSW